MRASSRREFMQQAGALALALLFTSTAEAKADDLITLQRAELVKRGDTYQLLGGFNVRLTAALEEALQKGIPLRFTQQFEADRPRDYWFADDVTVSSRALRLTYHTLLRYYQIEADKRVWSEDTLAGALQAVGDLSEWPVLKATDLNRKHLYRARVRMSLDVSHLPKPLQVNAVTSTRWELDSGWQEWAFRP